MINQCKVECLVEFESMVLNELIPYVQLKAVLKIPNETNIIGEAIINIYNGKHYTQSEIKRQCNNIENFQQYELLSSVRIFKNRYEAQEFDINSYKNIWNHTEESIDTPTFQFQRERGISYLGVYEDKAYDRNTQNVYGVLGLMCSLNISEEYQNKGYGKAFIQKIIDYCSLHGINFLMVNPYPTYLTEVLYVDVSKAADILISLGFQQSKGKTKVPHYVLNLEQ